MTSPSTGLGILIIAGLTIVLMFLFIGCKEKDQEEVASDSFDPGGGAGGGGGGGDDDSADDDAGDDDTGDDDTADDDDDTDDDDSTSPNVLVVFGETTYNTELENFLTAYGFEATFVNEVNLPGFQFEPYSLILATQTCEFYDHTEWEAIQQSGLKILGMYEGGGILFGKLGLFASLSTAYGYTGDRIIAADLALDIWKEPYTVNATTQGVVTMSDLNINVFAHSITGIPGDVTYFAELWGHTGSTPFSLQQTSYIYWGFEFAPTYYTQDALKLLANSLYYLIYH